MIVAQHWQYIVHAGHNFRPETRETGEKLIPDMATALLQHAELVCRGMSKEDVHEPVRMDDFRQVTLASCCGQVQVNELYG